MSKEEMKEFAENLIYFYDMNYEGRKEFTVDIMYYIEESIKNGEFESTDDVKLINESVENEFVKHFKNCGYSCYYNGNEIQFIKEEE